MRSYTVADRSAAAVQRRYLASALATRFPGFNEVAYPDWTALLQRLDRESSSQGWQGPLIIDELPNLVAAEPGILTVLQNWLDAPERKVALVTSGSSVRMMHSALLDSGAPLYGRATEAFAVQPLAGGLPCRCVCAGNPSRAGLGLFRLGWNATLLGTG